MPPGKPRRGTPKPSRQGPGHSETGTAIERQPGSPWLVLAIVAVLFAAGLAGRVAALNLPRISASRVVTTHTRWEPSAFRRFLENDEKIYVALVEQLEAGRGYTLQGHAILSEPWIVSEQYGRKLFFHPPGGVGLFWLMHRIAGDQGYPLAQVFSYGVFFASLMWLGTLVIRPFGPIAATALGSLGAITPLMAHAVGRFWLDGPLLAFATLASALFVAGALRRRFGLVVLAGVTLGFATLIKATAVLVVPGALALVWAIQPGQTWRELGRACAAWLAVAFLAHAPWLIWQWSELGTPFPAWSGRPDPRLVRSNGYVHYLTVVRTSWTYLELLPQVMWTLVPAVLLWLRTRRVGDSGRIGAALLIWIGTVVGAHMVLGSMGYSKVLRYVILMVPGAALLFALALDRGLRIIRPRGRLAAGVVVLVVLAIAGLGLEIAQGLRSSLIDNARQDLIQPLLSGRDN